MRFETKNRSGFSLMELIVVMAIISLLASMATKYWRQTQGRARDIQALNDANVLFKDLIDAYNEYKEIEFDEPEAMGWIGTPNFYKLDGGVVALITPGSAINGRWGGFFEATLYNKMGTKYGVVPRPYYIYINDNEGVMEKTF